MAKDEKSERVLGLSEDIIRMNPAHYTVLALQSGHNIHTQKKSS